jgi:hypothetical protein
MRYIEAGMLPFTVKASVFDPKEVPTVTEILLAGLTQVSLGPLAPATKTLIGWLSGSPQKDYISNLWADGRTIVVKQYMVGDNKTEFLELEVRR